ncbi:hypothetical protein GDO86_018161 [Hymenochirus boettgeri]|uniref:Uncharacterized protein n=1 Tax=Hymenochirus boettgeri TaxID=247094 RepID=A0A8T2IFY3_9PIPI|nr:hypothetical protein GDO86_018161 [Hymenochirus boettgeri]
MCTGKCSRFVGLSLFPFSAICIIANLFLFFPGWSVDWVKNANEYITPEVYFLGGIIGGGVLVLVPAVHIQATGSRENCCNNRCGMFLSIIFAVIGGVGAIYALAVSVLGMVNGPVCLHKDPSHNELIWGQPFKSSLEKFSNESYLFNKNLWSVCEKPEGVTEFNIVLFSIILVASIIQLALCTIQIVNGLVGCLCGTCQKRN